MQVPEHLQGNAPHRMLGDSPEYQIAQLTEQHRAETQHPIGQQQRQRQHDCAMLHPVEIIDDVLQDQRQGDAGQLGQHQETQGNAYPAAVFPEIGQQNLRGAPFLRRRPVMGLLLRGNAALGAGASHAPARIGEVVMRLA